MGGAVIEPTLASRVLGCMRALLIVIPVLGSLAGFAQPGAMEQPLHVVVTLDHDLLTIAVPAGLRNCTDPVVGIVTPRS